MGNQLSYDRYIWFDRQIRAGRYPNAGQLARQYECSLKTARRAIEFMRTMLDAPLAYDSAKKGFYYTELSFSLPPLQVSQEEILSLLLARTLLTASAGGAISRAIGRFGRKLFADRDLGGLTEAAIGQSFSAVWPGHSPGQAATFQTLAEAVLARQALALHYRSPTTGGLSQRTVHPHHLQHYMGSWVLLAWCTLRGQWRRFYLARITAATRSGEEFPPHPPGEWRHLLQDGFGIFQAETTFPVTLRFTPIWGRRLREQLWHPRQEMAWEADGSLLLTLPVADLREIKLKVLSFGAGVEVIQPPLLRDQIRQELAAMKKIYPG